MRTLRSLPACKGKNAEQDLYNTCGPSTSDPILRPYANGMELFPVDHPSVNASYDDPEKKEEEGQTLGTESEYPYSYCRLLYETCISSIDTVSCRTVP
jgi:hypothetical protein